MRRVEVTPYNEQWVQMYEEEAEKLRRIFGRQLIAIHHIGSTAVPGLDAKPIIDIMPVVRDSHNIDSYIQGMETLVKEIEQRALEWHWKNHKS